MRIEIVALLLIQVALFGVYATTLLRKHGIERRTVEHFLFARTERDRGYSASQLKWAAITAYFQAATSLVLGFEYGYSYGLIITLTAVGFGLGMALLHRFLSANVGHGDQSFFAVRLPFDAVFHTFSPSVRVILQFFVYLVLPFSAVIEVWYAVSLVEAAYIGVGSVSVGELAGFRTILGLTLFGLICVATSIFICAGGYFSVILSDRIQAQLVFVILLVFVAGTIAIILDNQEMQLSRFVFGATGIPTGSKVAWLIALLIGSLILNICWQFVEPQQWHRAATADTKDAYLSSLPSAALWTSVLWAVPAFLGALVAGHHVAPSDLGRTSALPMIALWKMIGPSLGFAILAVASAGVVAAATSTIEAVLMAFVARSATALGVQKVSTIRYLALATCLTVFAAAWGLYVLKPDLVSLIFALFPAQLYFLPFVVAFLRRRGREQELILSRAALVVTGYALCLVAALSLNLLPVSGTSVPDVWPTLALLVPIASLMVGWLTLRWAQAPDSM